MKKNSVREIVLAGLFIALGIVLPMVFHVFGSGPALLPMHIPVLLAGFVVSAPVAIAVGMITPILSSVLTGMPPLFPVLPYMMFELAAYGGITSFLYKKLNFNVYVTLVCSMVAGRIVSAMVIWILATFFMAKLPSPIVFITGAVMHGIPGIIIQIIFIQAIIYSLNKGRLIVREGNY